MEDVMTHGGFAAWWCRGCVLLLLCAPAHGVRASATRYFGAGDNAGTATDCTDPNAPSLCTLRDALHAAANGDTIARPPGSHNTLSIILSNGPLTINKSVTLQGAGLLTVDGGGATRVFQITGGTVEIDGMMVTHGFDAMLGAGIFVSGGSLTLVGCVVTGNTLSSADSGMQGGGIATFSDLTLIDTTVSDNTITLTGTGSAGRTVYGGGIYQEAGTLTVTASTVSGNTSNPQGGGIYVEGRWR